MISFITGLRGVFAGQKTYVVAIMIVLCGVVEGAFGFDIPGVEVGDDWLMYILNGFGLGTLRAGVAKAMINRL